MNDEQYTLLATERVTTVPDTKRLYYVPVLLCLMVAIMLLTVRARRARADGEIALERPQLQVQTGHSRVLTDVAFSSDGRRVLTGSDDGTARLWDAVTGRELRHFVADSQVWSVAFAPEGMKILTGCSRSTVLWDSVRGSRALPPMLHDSRVTCAAFAPDGRFLVTGMADGKALLRDPVTGREHLTLKGHSKSVRCVAFAPDGRRVLTGSDDETARLWDTASGLELRLISGLSHVRCVAFAPDGRTVLIGSNRPMTWLWDATSGVKIRPLQGLTDTVLRAAFTRDGQSVITGSPDGVVQMWGVMTGRELRRFEVGHKVTTMAFAPDGRTAVTGSNDGVAKLWEVTTGRQLHRLEGYADEVSSVSFAPNGRTIITGTGDGMARLWDLAEGREACLLVGHTGKLNDIAYSSDGRMVLTGSSDGTARLWDAATGRKLRPFVGGSSEIASVAFAPDGKTVLTGSVNGTAQLWQVEAEGESRTLQESRSFGGILDAAFSQDGRTILTGTRNGMVHRWDFASCREIKPPLQGHEGSVYWVGFSRDGRMVLTGAQDGTARLWEADSGRQLQCINVSQSATSMAFSYDGRRAVTGSRDTIVRLWDVMTNRELPSLKGHGEWVRSVAFSPDGRMVLSGSLDGTARLWEVEFSRELCRFIGFRDGRSAVVDTVGRFDMNSLEVTPGFSWIFHDDPFRPLSLEIYARDFFEPRLLPRLLAGERFSEPLRSLAELNRVQPEIADPTVRPNGDIARVVLRVRATGNCDSFGERGEMKTDAYDLRLLRDGQLVWQYPSPDDEPSRDLSIRTDVQLKAWRNDYRIVPNRPDGWYETTVEVRLPHNAKAGKPVRFEAYCFNEDRVKSRTAATAVPMPTGLKRVRPKAYVICLGVNASQTRKLDLRFAAADARDIGSRLRRALEAQDYKVVPITLISDFEEPRYTGRVVPQDATKENLRTVLSQLAGETASPEVRNHLPVEARNLPRSGPDDLVVLYAAGHGYTDPADGMFYLLPYDVGDYTNALRGDAKAREAAFREIFMRSVSSSELSQWLRGVDAAQHVLILDTCMSQGAIASAASEFKPGPFGSRGLGQLAYDKAMLVLAASQTDEFAVETDRGGLKHGLLTYTLLEGMKPVDPGQPPRAAAKGGILTLTGLLQYAADQVPEVYKAAKAGQLEKRGLAAQSKSSVEPWADRTKAEIEQRWPSLAGPGGPGAQRPVLFDYRSGRPDVNLSGDMP